MRFGIMSMQLNALIPHNLPSINLEQAQASMEVIRLLRPKLAALPYSAGHKQIKPLLCITPSG